MKDMKRFRRHKEFVFVVSTYESVKPFRKPKQTNKQKFKDSISTGTHYLKMEAVLKKHLIKGSEGLH